ncbi:MAG TPA: 30S ribosome-binding factor RbfA [Planctomycetaceae bacterium]|nr:ribosome-binding factor A [Blastopirellula sp.]HAY80093.1 30S ribosome-binding factor RbfA [Planctomycetaceae bacterium]|tara:strand:+ start:411 stop:839 length:429 start_codon:yes stop_codon:yes gene_type:complete
MTSRRVLKVAQAIREVVSMAILTDLRDPRIENVTVTFVEVSADLRHSKVHVSVMGDEKQQQLCLHGLQNSAGYLQQKVSNRIDLRYTPRLKFVLDQGVKNAIEITRILGELLPEKEDTTSTPNHHVPDTTSPVDGASVDGEH